MISGKTPLAKGTYIKYLGGGGVRSGKCCSPGDHRPKYFMAQ